jgi:hypothetical protein
MSLVLVFLVLAFYMRMADEDFLIPLPLEEEA